MNEHHQRRLWHRAVLIVLGLVVVTMAPHAGTVIVFGPQTITRTTGKPNVFDFAFNVLNPSLPYILRIDNEGITSAVVTLNGVQVLVPRDFKADQTGEKHDDARDERSDDDDDKDGRHRPVTLIQRNVTVRASNALKVELRSKPGGRLTIRILGADNQPPTITAAATPGPNGAGWNSTDVKVAFTCADAGSGIATCAPPRTVTTEGRGQVITGTATDNAGNTAAASLTLNIDKAPPTVAVNASAQPNAAGWINTEVAVAFTCSDATSGIDVCPPPVTVSTDGANQTVSGTARDLAGNTANAKLTLNIDRTPPTVRAFASTGGIGNADVTVRFECEDAVSGIAECPATRIVNDEGLNQTVEGIAVDRAGNRATARASVSIDRTKPTIVATIDPAANANGWHNQDVTVTFACGDSAAGVSSCPGAVVVSTEGAKQIVSRTTTDKAGNSNTASVTLNIDRTPPVVTIASPAAAATLTTAPAALSGTATDALSGIRSAACGGAVVVPGANGALNCLTALIEGSNTLTLTATDAAGNTGLSHVDVSYRPNRRPTANAGGPYVGEAGVPVPFNGATSTDRDNDPLTYAWDFGDSGKSSDPSPSHIYAQAGTFVVSLIVNDGRGSTDTATTTAVVAAAVDRTPPVITVSGPTQALPGAHVTISADAADNVGVASVTFDVNGLTPIEIVAPPFQRTVNVPDFAAPGATLKIRATARDAAGNAQAATLELAIVAEPDNEKPTVTVKVPTQAAPGTVLQIGATASDNAGIASVVLAVNGSTIASLTAPPYETTYAVPADTPVGSSLTLSAQAIDTADNQSTSSAIVTIVQTADTTPPIVAITAPAMVVAGAGIALSATAMDAGGIASVRFFVDGVKVAALLDPPYEATVPTSSTLPAGSRVHVEARAVDFSGLQGVAAQDVDVVAAGTGVLTGEVYDDGSGLPIENATVALAGSDARGVSYAQGSVTDRHGRYVIHASEGTGSLLIAKNGWSAVQRSAVVKPNKAIELVDARLTVATAGAAIAALSGGVIVADKAASLRVWQREVSIAEDPSAGSPSAGDADVKLTIPPGALTADGVLSLTPLSRQALAGLLPAGWTPVAIADIAPHGTALAGGASLSAPNPLKLTAGTPIVLARWDEQARGWRALASTVLSEDKGGLEATIPATGQYAWLVADAAPMVPPQPVPGDLVSGVIAALIPPDASAVVNPQPKILFYKPGVKSDVRGTVATTAEPLSSGTIVRSRIIETYQFVSKAEMFLEPEEQDLVLYQIPGGASRVMAAGFPISPSLVFEALSLEKGVITVELRAPEETVHEIDLVGTDGGAVATPTGERLEVKAGGVPVTVPIDIRAIPAGELGIAVPPGFEFADAASISFAGALTAPATFSIPRPASAGAADTFVLTRLQELAGETRFVLVGTGNVAADRIVAETTLTGTDATFEGLRKAGRYVFLRAVDPLAFAAGSITGAGAGGFEGALVTSSTLAIVSVSQSGGRFISALALGDAALTAVDLEKTDSASAQVTTSVPRQVVALDLALLARPPTVTSVTPADGSSNVALSDPIVVHFTSPIDPGTATSEAIRLTSSAGSVAGTLAFSAKNTVVTFRAAQALDPNTSYTVTLTQGIKDPFGRSLPSPFAATFTSLDTIAPAQPPAGSISATIPGADGKTTITATQGTAGPHDTVAIKNVTKGTFTPVVIEANGGFMVVVQATSTDKLQIVVRDAAGNETTALIPPFRRTNADGSVSQAVGAEGGHIEGPNGTAVDVQSGTFPTGTIVTVSWVAEADFAVVLTPEQRQLFTYSGGVQLNLGGVEPLKYLNVGIATNGGETAEDQWVVTRPRDIGGRLALEPIDTAHVIDGRIRTSSPPCPGVTGAGTYGFMKSSGPVGVIFGSIVANFSDVVASIIGASGSPMPYEKFASELQRTKEAFCLPVLTGRVGSFATTTSLSMDLPELAIRGYDPKNFRQVVITNASRNNAKTDLSTPDGVIAGNNRFVVEGAIADSYTVEATDFLGNPTVVCADVDSPPCDKTVGLQFATLTVPAAALSEFAHEIVVRNVTQSNRVIAGLPPTSQVETKFFHQCAHPAVSCATPDRQLLFEGAATNVYDVDIVELKNGSSITSPVFRSVTAVPYLVGPGHLIVRAVPGTIDPTEDQILVHNTLHGPTHAVIVNGITKAEAFNRTRGVRTTILDVAAHDTRRIVEGGFYFAIDGSFGDSIEIAVAYQDGQTNVMTLPTFQIELKIRSTGTVVANVAQFAPPRDKSLTIGVLSDTSVTDTPHLTTSAEALTGIDPTARIRLTFTSPTPLLDDTIRRGAILQDQAGNRVSGGWVFQGQDGLTWHADFFPQSRLRMGEQYTISLTGVQDNHGAQMPFASRTFRTFAPALIGAATRGKDGRVLEPVRDLVMHRDATTAKTTVVAITDVRSSRLSTTLLDRLIMLDVTEPRRPLELGNTGLSWGKRVALIPGASLNLRKDMGTSCAVHTTTGSSRRFTGDLAIALSGKPGDSTLHLFDVTDSTSPCVLASRAQSSNPQTLTDVEDVRRLASVFLPGTARGLGVAETADGIATFAAVRDVGLVASDVGRNIPDWLTAERSVADKAIVARGDHADVAIFNGRVLALNRNFTESGSTLEILTPNLSPITTVDINDAANRLVVAEGLTLQFLDRPKRTVNLAFVAGAQRIWVVDISAIDLPVLIGSIPMPGIIRELAVDVSRSRLYAGGDRPGNSASEKILYVIDVTDPFRTGLIDAETAFNQVTIGSAGIDGFGLDDRIIWTVAYPDGINGIASDGDRGLVYIGTSTGVDIIDMEGQFVTILDRPSQVHQGVSFPIAAVGTGALTWTTSDASVIALKGSTTSSRISLDPKGKGHATITVTLAGKTTTTSDSIDVDVLPFSILEISGVPEGDKLTVGGVLVVNDDDDNGNHVPDFRDATVLNENDLIRIIVRPVLPSKAAGTIILDSTATNILLWSTPNKQGTALTLPATFNSPADLPNELFVEGIGASHGLRDILLTANYTNTDSGDSSVDAVSLSVVKVGFLPRVACCVGFDATTNPPWLVVPESGSKTDVVVAITPADAASTLTLITSNGAIVTATLGNSVVVGAVTVVSTDIHGVAEGEASLTLHVAHSSAATLSISVRRERRVDIAFHYLNDGVSTTNRPATEADADQAIAEMNRIWFPQTNVKFVRHGLPQQQTIGYTNGSIFVGQGFCDDSRVNKEYHDVLAAANRDPTVDINIFFVWSWNGGPFDKKNTKDFIGMTVSECDGLMTVLVSNQQDRQTEAHEAGHFFGNGHSSGPNDLMAESGSGEQITKSQSDMAHEFLIGKKK